MNILVTGAAGYIGTHTCVELLESGFNVVAVDNLYNSKQESLKRVEKITGRSLTFYNADIRDKSALSKIFSQHNIEAVIHFAGLKAVGESEQKPLMYYDVNVNGSTILAEEMEKHGCRKIVFSSSATVYGPEAAIPYTENSPTAPSNVYGRTKWMVEHIFQDLCRMPNNTWRVSLLRYFNPIGAHKSGQIGEDPQGIPNNLMPFIAQVAVGLREKLSIFGDDYATIDGTGVRDYIHVVDLAKGHVAAIKKMTNQNPGTYIYNLGSGKGTSVLELVRAFEKQNNIDIPYAVVPRRAGDLPEFYANPILAKNELNWQTELTIDDMVRDTWHWQKNNPKGY